MRAKSDLANAPSQMRFDHSSGCAPLAQVLKRAGTELAQVAEQLQNLEILLGPLFLSAAHGAPHFLQSVQGFDHIGQKASGLARFLIAFAACVPDQWMIDPAEAASEVTLADLSARLSFAPDREGAPADCGEVDLF